MHCMLLDSVSQSRQTRCDELQWGNRATRKMIQGNLYNMEVYSIHKHCLVSFQLSLQWYVVMQTVLYLKFLLCKCWRQHGRQCQPPECHIPLTIPLILQNVLLWSMSSSCSHVMAWGVHAVRRSMARNQTISYKLYDGSHSYLVYQNEILGGHLWTAQERYR